MALGSTRSFINQNNEGHTILGTNVNAVLPSIQQHVALSKRGAYNSGDVDLINSSADVKARDQIRQQISVVDTNTGRTVVSDTLEKKAPISQPQGHTSTQQSIVGSANLGLQQENQIRDFTNGPTLSMLPDNQITPSITPTQTFIANLDVPQEQQIQTMNVATSKTAQNSIQTLNPEVTTGDITKLQFPPLLVIGLIGALLLWSVTR